MFKQIFNDLKDTTTERFSSPILGTFTIFWLVLNWKIPLILIFSNKNIEERILKIEELFNIFNGLTNPLILTFIFLLVYPVIKNIYSHIEIFNRNNLEKIKYLLQAEKVINDRRLDYFHDYIDKFDKKSKDFKELLDNEITFRKL